MLAAIYVKNNNLIILDPSGFWRHYIAVEGTYKSVFDKNHSKPKRKKS